MSPPSPFHQRKDIMKTPTTSSRRYLFEKSADVSGKKKLTKMEERMAKREEEEEMIERGYRFSSDDSGDSEFYNSRQTGDRKRPFPSKESDDGMNTEIPKTNDEQFARAEAEDSKLYGNEKVTPEHMTKKRKEFSSERNVWKPVALMKNCCFDSSTGVLYSKEMCENNINNYLKSKKNIDFYDLLKYSKSPDTLALSFSLFMLSKLMQKPVNSDETKELNLINSRFSLESAREVDEEVLLPGGKRLLLSMLIDSQLTSNWVGTGILTKCVCSILDEIQLRDDFFVLYSSPESSKRTTYPRLDGTFFLTFARVIRAGFDLASDSNTVTSLVTNLKTITRNYIDKHRTKVGEKALKLIFNSFKEKYEGNSSFRYSEKSIQDSSPRDRQFFMKSPMEKKKSTDLHNFSTPTGGEVTAKETANVLQTIVSPPQISKNPIEMASPMTAGISESPKEPLSVAANPIKSTSSTPTSKVISSSPNGYVKSDHKPKYRLDHMLNKKPKNPRRAPKAVGFENDSEARTVAGPSDQYEQLTVAKTRTSNRVPRKTPF